MDYFKPGAKEEQKKRVEQQVDSVRDKITKWADKIIVGQYTGTQQEEHKEGDTWEDSDGKSWTILHGIRQSIRKTQSAVNPWWCPKCGKTLSSKLDSKFYRIRGTCHDCVVEYEGKMRIAGVWEVYERRTMRRNALAYAQEQIDKIDDYIRTFKDPQMHFQDGRWEKLATKELFEEKFDEYRRDKARILLEMAQILKDEEADADNYKQLEEWESSNPWIPNKEL